MNYSNFAEILPLVGIVAISTLSACFLYTIWRMVRFIRAERHLVEILRHHRPELQDDTSNDQISAWQKTMIESLEELSAAERSEVKRPLEQRQYVEKLRAKTLETAIGA